MSSWKCCGGYDDHEPNCWKIEIQKQLTATTQALDAAVEVIEAALRLQDLWLYHGKISVEHAHEANALNLMKHRFEESLEKIKALKGVE